MSQDSASLFYPKPVKPLLGNPSKKGITELYIEAFEGLIFK
jgi:hypothetical protein